ncbi:hypothetical protein ACLM5J_07810 [Nocardioides sp. Bht2]|uniref:hypothetical protein n=1 Tax=Nocardioides sp. Bht2 TaxID=3392297 RepID=UPI0039B3E2B9
MTIQVLVNRDPAAPFSNSWEHVGTLETSEPRINQQAGRKLQQVSAGGAVRIEFYLSGEADNDWVRDKTGHARFGIAFDLFGDGTRVLVSENGGYVAPLSSRPPEPRPGLLKRPIQLGVKVNGKLRRVPGK